MPSFPARRSGVGRPSLPRLVFSLTRPPLPLHSRGSHPMRKIALLTAGLFVAAFHTGVAGAQASPESPPAATAPRPPSRSGPLTQPEIDESRQDNAYGVLQRLRPRWLRKRGPRDLEDNSDILVYVDGTYMGGPEALRSVSAATIGSIAFLNPG